jgi:hypothetical protein
LPQSQFPCRTPHRSDVLVGEFDGCHTPAAHEQMLLERRRIVIGQGVHDVHRELGSYPGPNQRMPNCCQVMKRLMATQDRILTAPPKGVGASLVVRYEAYATFVQ